MEAEEAGLTGPAVRASRGPAAGSCTSALGVRTLGDRGTRDAVGIRASLAAAVVVSTLVVRAWKRLRGHRD